LIGVVDNNEVFGDIESNSADVLGKIKGNCVWHSGIIIRESGSILGKINANDITIEKGATVQGSINIVRDVFFELDAS
jgi:cytoskeletal protein CcmA (bactofilin family)